MGELIQRRAGVGVFLRGATMLQFGQDATRVGVVDTAHAAAVARVLADASQPCAVEDLQRRLCSVGLDSTAAQSLLEDLLSFGILQEIPSRATITVLGDSALSLAVQAALRRDGFSVRTPHQAEHNVAYIATMLADAPVLAIDCAHQAHYLSSALLKSARTWMPLQEIDHRLVVGPFHKDGRGPCLLCMNLHRGDLDPAWSHLMAQVPAVDVQPDEVHHSFFTAYAVAVARYLVGRRSPPGAMPMHFGIGEVVEMELYGLPQRRFVQAHPRCPVCFAASHSQHPVAKWVDAPF